MIIFAFMLVFREKSLYFKSEDNKNDKESINADDFIFDEARTNRLEH